MKCHPIRICNVAVPSCMTTIEHRPLSLYANQRPIMKEHNPLEKWRAASDDSQHFHRRRVACIADAVYLFVQNSANLVAKKP
ncbi:hypothetical protein ACFXTO_018691 [Malus domestica]